MKLHKKTLVLLGVTFTTLIIIQYAASQLVFLNSFATLEQQDTTQNVERAINALNADVNNLDAFVYDWAAWDDTYSFIQDINEQYIESNLVDETFIGSELNLMVYVNSSGEIVYSKAFDLENEEETAVPESIQQYLTTNTALLQHSKTDSTVKGLLLLPENPIILVSRPIITSTDEGPILGSLIMGYYLDSTKINELAKTTQLSIEIQQLDSQVTADVQEAIASITDEEPIFIKPINSEHVAGYTIIKDINGEAGLALKVELPRNIYQQGQSTSIYFMIIVLTTSIIVTAVSMIGLAKGVLSRLTQLSTSVKGISSQQNPAKRVTVTGKNDEITDLADEINRMLATLEQSQDKLQITNEKLSVVGKLTRHDIRNKLSVIVNYVYLAKQKVAGNSDVTAHLDNIDSTIDQLESILNFSKTYEAVGVEEPSYIEVKGFVQEIVMFLGLSNIKFVNELDGLTLLADSLLRQIFFNLINDTLKNEEKVNQIRVYYETGKDELKLIYEDNSSGVPENEKELIFNETYGKDTGYALYLTRKICEAYGWSIQETGKHGKGVKFVITIPKINKNKKQNYHIK
ncbi:MAG: ATP-binding protein [Candidatus Bathyarchaeota archaeon]|nr:ATP-binding protein [Candidatus Bathyarchaeum sp.]